MLVLNVLVLPSLDNKIYVLRVHDGVLLREVRHLGVVEHNGGYPGAARQDCQREDGERFLHGLVAALGAARHVIMALLGVVRGSKHGSKLPGEK